jgi:hypothetical protein
VGLRSTKPPANSVNAMMMDALATLLPNAKKPFLIFLLLLIGT